METNGKPLPHRPANAGVEKLIDARGVNLGQCDWSKINQVPSHDEMAKIMAMMRKDEDPMAVEQEYLELIKNRDQLSSLTALIEEFESGAGTRAP